jgi:hypothetical protein
VFLIQQVMFEVPPEYIEPKSKDVNSEVQALSE